MDKDIWRNDTRNYEMENVEFKWNKIELLKIKIE